MKDSFASGRSKRLIQTEAIIVAYAMSRIDAAFLSHFAFKSWRQAFQASGDSLGVPPASMKNLRDEFDPLHGVRVGWHQRQLRPNRMRVLSELCEVSDEALLEIAGRLMQRDRRLTEEIVTPLAFAAERVSNVAERLRTGRFAEQFFLRHAEDICGLRAGQIVDRRQDATGFDFSVSGRPEIAVEVKGLKSTRGPILFTDLEWRTARIRAESYWLVVVGNIPARPTARVWRNPVRVIGASSSIRRATTVSWEAIVSVA